MKLPQHIATCINRLEDAGFSAYCVGGCVRDWVSGRQPHDYDICTSATPAQLRTLFANYPLVLAGEKHGTVAVVMAHELVEITTYRTEGDYQDSRHPGWVHFETEIEADLSRRDFTVNAMAWSPKRGFADPFGGRKDLETGVLRCVGNPEARFTEDALRILRGVRFAVRFGLQVDSATENAMHSLRHLMDGLARERVMDELMKLLPFVTAADLLRFAPILEQIIPELSPCIGFQQRNPHHLYDVYTHTAHTVAACPADPALRLAALLHDIGKPACFVTDDNGIGHFYGHDELSAQMANSILHRLKASNELRHRITQVIGCHMTPLNPNKRSLRRRMAKLGTEGVRDLLALQRADRIGTGTGDVSFFDPVEALIQELLAENACFSLKDLAINGHDLMELGFSGKAIGNCLSSLLELVLDERIPNETTALLREAERYSKIP